MDLPWVLDLMGVSTIVQWVSGYYLEIHEMNLSK